MKTRKQVLELHDEPNPTKETYDQLNQAYDFFNRRLFSEKLPRCLVTLQRKRGSLGYFAGERFHERTSKQSADEIALNPRHFEGLTTQNILGVLAHEMAHQYEFRCVSHKKKSYHDKSWAGIMKSIGLYPSTTAQPGGKETGWRVSHYVVEGGPFSLACAELIAKGSKINYVEVIHDPERQKKQKESKTKFTCPSCDMNVWGAPSVEVTCTDCQMPMKPEESD